MMQEFIVIILRAVNQFFEINTKKHHDHLVCLKCGKVVEFEDVVNNDRVDGQANNMSLINHTCIYMVNARRLRDDDMLV
jgi:Fe2+ or Zn2+ uptake regulation protein